MEAPETTIRTSKRLAGLAIAGLGAFALTFGNAAVANAKLVAPDGCVSIGCPDAQILGFDPNGWTHMTGHNTLYAIWVPVSIPTD